MGTCRHAQLFQKDVLDIFGIFRNAITIWKIMGKLCEHCANKTVIGVDHTSGKRSRIVFCSTSLEMCFLSGSCLTVGGALWN